MNSRVVRWTKRALRRLDQLGGSIAQDSPDAATRVIARIVSAVDNLAERPAMGRPGRIAETRELVFADIPYIVAYRVTPDAVDILTVMHAAQEWPSKLS
ncbi:toxin Y4kP [Rhodoblastus sphagnicola]|uniref:Toxin Y4kP n=1 Tax=Rhodoblastus sphagnicola TaxID=333368 RepID=A0A2S6NDV6_9HYPH|nr:type II toxin-antitoxin system RelE/ParE family toxin [Rhodoblastus sphagnicola]MBB4198499.1 addiction module RelE/StbE family toxin [Rhodoblastus sphagnicola]PPQ32780.1 toxin Y4kP [Rhodoblastus sphagnicola]